MYGELSEKPQPRDWATLVMQGLRLVDLLGIEPRRLDCQPSVLPLSLQARIGGERGSRTHSICVQGRCIPVLLAPRNEPVCFHYTIR